MKSQAILTALLATLTTALPTETYHQTKPFFISLTEQKNPTHNGLRMTVIHVAGGQNVPVFRNPASSGTPAFLNDTRANIKGDHAYLQFDLGAPKGTGPYTMAVPSAKSHLQFVEVVPGMNSEQFSVVKDESGEKVLAIYNFEEGAGFYACKTTFDGGATHEIALKWGGGVDYQPPKGCDVAHMIVNKVPKVDQ